jgi:hypothetical protein
MLGSQPTSEVWAWMHEYSFPSNVTNWWTAYAVFGCHGVGLWPQADTAASPTIIPTLSKTTNALFIHKSPLELVPTHICRRKEGGQRSLPDPSAKTIILWLWNDGAEVFAGRKATKIQKRRHGSERIHVLIKRFNRF